MQRLRKRTRTGQRLDLCRFEERMFDLLGGIEVLRTPGIELFCENQLRERN